MLRHSVPCRCRSCISFMFDGKHTCTVKKCPPVTGKYFDGTGICNAKDCTNIPEVGGRGSGQRTCHPERSGLCLCLTFWNQNRRVFATCRKAGPLDLVNVVSSAVLRPLFLLAGSSLVVVTQSHAPMLQCVLCVCVLLCTPCVCLCVLLC